MNSIVENGKFSKPVATLICPLIGQRHLQVFLLFTAIVVNYIAKLNASVAIVAMTNANTTNPNFPEYEWTDMQKEYIQSTFYWGYCLTQFPGGYICRRFGAKFALLVSTFGSSFFSILLPFYINWGGWQIYCAIRLAQGLFQGLLFPSLFANLAVWCPLNERTRLCAIANMGMDCGTLLSMLVSGVIASSSIGWPGIFYVTGGLGLIWCVAWLLFAANKPSESRYITAEELNYINADKNIAKEVEGLEMKGKAPVPWRAILTSMPVWSLVIMRTAYAWGYNTLQAQLPTYMKSVHKMDMSQNALYSALPYVAMLTMANVYAIVADVLLTRKILSLAALRKSFNTVAYWIPAVLLIILGFLGEQQTTLVVILMTSIVGLSSGGTIGHAINIIELAPNFADVIMGVVNSVSNAMPIFTPLVVAMLVSDTSDPKEWQIIFAICAAIYGVGNLIFLIFGKMEVQPWNDQNFSQPKYADDFNETINSTKSSELNSV